MKRVAVNLRDDAINVFPDGSSRSRPRRGGIGFRIVTFDAVGNEVREDEWLPGYKSATNQQMELLACIEAIRGALQHHRMREFNRIHVFTDSRYVVDNLYNAKFIWPKTQWCRTNGAPVLNEDLWKSLVKLIRDASPCKIEIEWAKGHSKGNPHNKAADQLAKISSTSAVKLALAPVQVRRKKSKNSTIPGSVRMEGQEMDIHILDPLTIRRHQLTRYRYEVLSPDSRYVGNIDFIFANSALDIRPGHHYRVKVNNDTKNPQIVELVEELERAPKSSLEKRD
jgi:ribonuclease HI